MGLRIYFTADVKITTTFKGSVVVEAEDEKEARLIILEDEDFEMPYEDMDEEMGPDIKVSNIRKGNFRIR